MLFLRFDSNLTGVQSKKDMAWLWKFAGKQAFWIGKGNIATFSVRKWSYSRTQSCIFPEYLFHMFTGLSGSPGHWTWTDGRSLSFSRLKRDRAQEQQPESAASRSTCVLAQSQKTWIPMTCTTAPERRYICSSPAQNHWKGMWITTLKGQYQHKYWQYFIWGSVL